MSSLTPRETSCLEQLLDMSGGYVLNFNDSTFGSFFGGSLNVDIHGEKYRKYGSSKAKKLRAFWEIEPDDLVGRALSELIDCAKSLPGNKDKAALISECRSIASRLMGGSANLASLGKLAVAFDAQHLAAQIARMEQSTESDPALAVGTAKELIETCCKTILAQRGKPVTNAPDLPTLTKDTFKELKLVPEGIPDQTKGRDTIKRLLSNLATICQGMAELRSMYGTGHGKEARTQPVKPRHARLAVGAAATLARFLFDTHEETKNQR